MARPARAARREISATAKSLLSSCDRHCTSAEAKLALHREKESRLIATKYDSPAVRFGSRNVRRSRCVYLKILATVRAGGARHSLAFVKGFAYKNPRRLALYSRRLRSRARNWRTQMIVLSWLWGIVRSVLNTIARVVVFALALIIVLVGIGLVAGDGLPSNMVLELD